MSKDTNFQDIFAHFPKQVSQGIVDFARDVALLQSRYIFTRRVKSLQYAYCTHCRKEYLRGPGTDYPLYLRHNEIKKCPKCQSVCTVKASGRGRKYLSDDAYFVYYEKSVIDPNAIVAWGLYVERDYSGNYYKTETKFRTVAMYLFQPGKSMMLYQSYWEDKWTKRKAVRSEFNNSMKNKSCYLSMESVESAVQGTPFQYSTWEKYTNQSADLVRFFDLAAKYPCVEYLTKLGLRGLIEAKLLDYQTYGVVNWRGKTLEKVLRMSKSQIKELRTSNIKIGPLVLHSYHFYRKHGLSLSFQEAHLLRGLSTGYYLSEAMKLSAYAPFTRIVRYILKQLRREDVRRGGVRGHFWEDSTVLITWRDYIRDCQELGMDLEQEHILFPNNLYAAHQKTIKKVKFKQDKELNLQIQARLKSLKKYNFEANGFILRPATDTAELIQEGNELSHCVGGYAKSYANGETNILLLRKASEPDKPFYTMEVRNGHITQCRGLKNCSPTDEVKAFIDLFTVKKLLTKKQTRVAQPA
ncbi:PcfJ domain-containing protein [Aneurinibacillus aneurinilyticus]|uniref:PcfJ domain-containing protein n=1 Tax=Aneurinibacillus aneurinilyticus TaxID=1391 RepID=UPI002E1D2607|nr:PcfJ domain-containing protein [Aneurinibacillus aneurinilyticus]